MNIINLYMIRHGLSCCNILHHKDLNLSLLNTIHKDPLLTIKGRDQSLRAGKYLENKIPKIDIVLSSSLIRAIETATCMFPNNEVHTIPYICEKNPSLENTPYDSHKQLKRVNMFLENKNKNIKFNKEKKGMSQSNLSLFLKYLKDNYSIEKNIAVVTHSNFLMEILNIENRMNNNSVFKVSIDLTNDKIIKQTCVFTGYSFPDKVSLDMMFR